MRDLPRAYRLADGAQVHVRHVRPSDERVLRAAFRELSARSRYQRFLGPVSELSDSHWRYLCDVDGRDHVAFIALDGESHPVGVARFVRQWIAPSSAEMAITVADAWQRRGAGSLLVALLAETARSVGVESFVAYALPNNVGIRRLLARRGPLRVSVAGGEETIVVQLCGSRAA
ncbi:MAG TPA: GNAT family N-acetyltransferase [Polyangiaceae bacterium]|nr:GNAT family N-acetyltransferase [Polyangiaceae bacterium]